MSPDYELEPWPSDGFRVRRVARHGNLALEMFVQAHGDAVIVAGNDAPEVELFSVSGDRITGVGACARMQLVLEAAARYLNTGGDWGQLFAALERARDWFHGAELSIGAGLTFLSTDLVTEPETGVAHYSHYFVGEQLEDGGRCGMIWEEGHFFEPMTLSTYLEVYVAGGLESEVTDVALATVGASDAVLLGVRDASESAGADAGEAAVVADDVQTAEPPAS